MKTLIAAFLLVSSSAFAQELDATDALLTTLPAKEYRGITPDGDDCQVAVRDLSSKVAIVATAGNLTRRAEVYSGAVYRWQPGQRFFLATNLTTTLNGSKENVFRTIAVTSNTQYVIVADEVINNREREVVKVECIIDL